MGRGNVSAHGSVNAFFRSFCLSHKIIVVQPTPIFVRKERGIPIHAQRQRPNHLSFLASVFVWILVSSFLTCIPSVATAGRLSPRSRYEACREYMNLRERYWCTYSSIIILILGLDAYPELMVCFIVGARRVGCAYWMRVMLLQRLASLYSSATNDLLVDGGNRLSSYLWWPEIRMGWFRSLGLVNSYVKAHTIGHSHHKLCAAVHVSTIQIFDCEWFCHALFSYTNAGWSLKMACPPYQFATSFRPICHDLASRTRGWPNRLSKCKFLWTAGPWSRRSASFLTAGYLQQWLVSCFMFWVCGRAITMSLMIGLKQIQKKPFLGRVYTINAQ